MGNAIKGSQQLRNEKRENWNGQESAERSGGGERREQGQSSVHHIHSSDFTNFCREERALSALRS